MKKNLLMLITLLVIFSCSKDNNETTDPETTDPETNVSETFTEAENQFESLKDEVITLTTSEGLTRWRELPTSGIMIFKGSHSGRFFEKETTSESKLAYYADVVLTVDFENQKFTGQLLNFKTDLEGFETPEGALNINGAFRSREDMGGDEIGFHFRVQEGSLKQGERMASFDAFTENKGRFYGNSAQFMALRVSSIFKWTEGPDAGTKSGTVGFMYAEME